MEKEIITALKDGNLVLGSRVVIKGMKTGKLRKVIYASNCPKDMVRDIMHYSNASKAECGEFTSNSSRLGELCGKPFTVLVVGIKK